MHLSLRQVQYRRGTRLIAAGLVVASAIVLRASAGASAAAPSVPAGANANTLVVAWWTPVDDIDPATSYSGTGAMVMRSVYDTLVRMKGSSTTTLEADLATSWKQTQNYKVWTFQLRHNVHFHDGSLLTANSVQKSYERLLKLNEGPASILSPFITTSGVKAAGPYTVRFTLKNPSDVFPRVLASEWGNGIISPKALKMPEKKLHTWLESHDAGSGPYRISSIVHGQNTVLAKFPGYWGGWSGQHVSKIIINNVTADATRRELVSKGDADLTVSLTPEDLQALSQNHQLKIDNTYGMRNVSLVMTDAGPLAKPAAREALGYAFDYNGLIKGLLKGYGRQAQGPLPRTLQGHNKALPMYHTDLAKARALLAKAGVAKGTKMTVWFENGDEVKRDVALVLQAQLSQLGIQLQVQAEDGSAFGNMFYGNTPPAQRPNFFVWYWYPDYNDPGDWLLPQFYSKAAGSAGSNGGFYHNAKVDSLLLKAQKVRQSSKRYGIYDQVQKILTWQDPAAVFVADLPESVLYRANVHGYYLNPVYTSTFDFYKISKS
jgi:peptide/nickel transport system substrate-binding protein